MSSRPPPPPPPSTGSGSPVSSGSRPKPPPPPKPGYNYVPLNDLNSTVKGNSPASEAVLVYPGEIVYPGEDPASNSAPSTSTSTSTSSWVPPPPATTKRKPPPPPPIKPSVVPAPIPPPITAPFSLLVSAHNSTTPSSGSTLVSSSLPVDKDKSDPYKSAYIDLSLPASPIPSSSKKTTKKWCGMVWWAWAILAGVVAVGAGIGIAVAVIKGKSNASASVESVGGGGVGVGETTSSLGATTGSATATVQVTTTVSPSASKTSGSPLAVTSKAASATQVSFATSPFAATTTGSVLTSPFATSTKLATTATSLLLTATSSSSWATVTPTQTIAPFVLGPRAFPTENSVADDGTKWSVNVGEYGVVPNNFGELNDFLWTVPDSFTPALPLSNPTTGQSHFLIYSESTNHRSVGPLPFPSSQTLFNPSRPGGWSQAIFGGRNESDLGPTNGGAWLMFVARHPVKGGSNLVGFYHSQDHVFGDPTKKNGTVITDAAGEAWKNVGVAYSSDDGVTWKDGGIVLSSFVPKPETPTWGGLGDFGAIWDWKASHWKVYFKEQQRLGVAVSTDPDAKPGSFYKWRWLGASGSQPDVSEWPAGTKEPPGPEWESPGLGGVYTGLPGLNDIPGANPGLHWNTYLQVWVAIWNSWNTTDPTITPNSLYIATSLDGLHFSTPRVLVTPKCKNSKAWHATVISAEGGSEYAGKRAKLYHSDCWTQDTGVGIYKDGREWVERDIEFERADGS